MTAPLPPVRVAYLVEWLREHRGDFTDDALRDRLLAAGHPPADVEAAFAALDAVGTAGAAGPAASDAVGTAGAPPVWTTAPAPPPTARPTSHPGDPLFGFLAAVGGIVGIPLLLTQVGAGNVAVVAGLIALALAVVAWGLFRESDRRGVATGLGTAVVLVVVLPVVAVVGLFGLCLVGGGPVI